MKGIVTHYQETGYCTLDIETTIKKWNSLFWIAQWKNEYRLIKYRRRNSGSTALKVSIAPQQAIDLIKRIGLTGYPGGFLSATTWRKDEQLD